MYEAMCSLGWGQTGFCNGGDTHNRRRRHPPLHDMEREEKQPNNVAHTNRGSSHQVLTSFTRRRRFRLLYCQFTRGGIVMLNTWDINRLDPSGGINNIKWHMTVTQTDCKALRCYCSYPRCSEGHPDVWRCFKPHFSPQISSWSSGPSAFQGCGGCVFLADSLSLQVPRGRMEMTT